MMALCGGAVVREVAKGERAKLLGKGCHIGVACLDFLYFFFLFRFFEGWWSQVVRGDPIPDVVRRDMNGPNQSEHHES